MVFPLLHFFDRLHGRLDAVELFWPLETVPPAWIREVHRRLHDEWMELDRRMRRLSPMLEYQEEANRRFLRCIGFFQLYLYREAKEQLDAIIRQVPDTVLSYLLRAAVLYELGDYEGALQDLRQLEPVVEYPPMNQLVQHLLGCVLAKMGCWEEAKERFEQVFRADPGNEEVMFNLALCYHHLGRRQKAIYLMQNLSALRPHDDQVKRLLAYFSRRSAT